VLILYTALRLMVSNTEPFLSLFVSEKNIIKGK